MEDGGLEELKMMLIKADSDRNSIMELLRDERQAACQEKREDKGLEELKMILFKANADRNSLMELPTQITLHLLHNI